MESLVKNLIEKNSLEKIQKPDCSTRAGRAFLAFFLQTKLKQIINVDKSAKKQGSVPLIAYIKEDFLERFTSRLIDRPSDRILAAISGESASGKSTICKQVRSAKEKFNLPLSFLSTDNYFRDISDKIKQYGNFDALRDSGFDVDSPDNFYLGQLRDDILKLQKGFDIMAPEYLVNGTGISKPKSKHIMPDKIILVEGMCSIYREVEDVFDIKIYVELDEETRRERFLNRAIQRNQDDDNALKHWNYIKDAGKKYVASRKSCCDIVINGNCDLKYIEYILEYIHKITNNFVEA